MTACCLLALALVAPLATAAAAAAAAQAPQAATTRTTMAEQVQQLEYAPAQYNAAAAAAALAPAPQAQQALAVFQQAAAAQLAPQAATSQQSTGQQAGPGQLPPLPQQPGTISFASTPSAGREMPLRSIKNISMQCSNGRACPMMVIAQACRGTRDLHNAQSVSLSCSCTSLARYSDRTLDNHLAALSGHMQVINVSCQLSHCV